MALRLCSLLLMAGLLLSAQAPANSTPPSTADDLIHDRVSLALTTDRDIRGGGIQVDVQNGVVTLKGRAPSKKARERATKLAKKVKGVTSVDNQLAVPDEK